MNIRSSRVVIFAVVLVTVLTMIIVQMSQGGKATSETGSVKVAPAPNPARNDLRASVVPAKSTVPEAPPMEPILAEAPSLIRDLHDTMGCSVKRNDPFSAVVRDAFARNPLFTGLSVTCASDRCEVHGTAAADEARTRLAIRDDAFLERLSALGLISGMDMVSQGTDGSEFIVYVDRNPPAN